MRRCSVLPVLSKQMLHIHRSFPPLRNVWYIRRCVTPGMVVWASSIAGSLEELYILEMPAAVPDLRPQLLMAARQAPKLHRLVVQGNICTGVLSSLAFLPTLLELTLEQCDMYGGSLLEPYGGLEYLARLRHLQVCRFFMTSYAWSNWQSWPTPL